MKLVLALILSGSISNVYPFINELLLYILIFLITVKYQDNLNSYFMIILVTIPFLITNILSTINSRLIDSLFQFNLNNIVVILFYEVILYVMIYFASVFTKNYLIPLIQAKNKEKETSLFLIGIYLMRQFFELNNNYFVSKHLSFTISAIILLFVILIFSFLQVNSVSQDLKLELEKQKIELKLMNEYSKNTNKQYNDIRNFKHDYINIISSLDYFIKMNDIQKLEKYYKETIQPTKEILSDEYFTINSLNNIESDGIKSILTVKLLAAKDMNINIKIEAIDPIPSKLSVSSVTLVRMLGIILDNCIEEVSFMENGEINVGFFDMGQHYLFVIENSTRENILPLHQLQVEGYSTKGENRGFGLSNLHNLSQREKYLTIETEITSTKFIQKLNLIKGDF